MTSIPVVINDPRHDNRFDTERYSSLTEQVLDESARELLWAAHQGGFEFNRRLQSVSNFLHRNSRDRYAKHGGG